jgi:ribosomal protein L37AE/L43A
VFAEELGSALDYNNRWQPNEYEPDGFVERVRPLQLTNGNHEQAGCPTCGARVFANRREVVWRITRCRDKVAAASRQQSIPVHGQSRLYGLDAPVRRKA